LYHNPRGEMPFLDHLEELRWRIFKSGGALVVACIVGFIVVHYYRVMELLIRPIRPFLPTGQLNVFSPATPFFIELKLALILGVIFAFPIILYQLWAFMSPALERRERRIIIPALYMGMCLFAAGVLLAYLIALPLTLRFFYGFQSEYLEWTIGVDQHLAFTVRLLLAFGIVFELPVVIMILAALGLVTPAYLRSKRRHAIVIITVVAAFLSPGDVIAVTALLMFPLIILYEVSILLAVFVRKKPQQEENSIQPPEAEAPEGAVEADRGDEER
jgi:sec-independent protein translocase protein TatC